MIAKRGVVVRRIPGQFSGGIMNATSAAVQVEGDVCPRFALCPLNRVRAGTLVRIKQLCVAADVCYRLREIGFGEDQIIQPLTGHSNIICLVCNASLAISAHLAENILVEPVVP